MADEHDSEWPPGLRIFEIIEVTKGDERTVCMIGAATDDIRFISVEVYVGEELVQQHRTGVDADIPIAELIEQTEEAARKDAIEMGANFEIFMVDPPFEQAQFQALLDQRKAASDPAEE